MIVPLQIESLTNVVYVCHLILYITKLYVITILNVLLYNILMNYCHLRILFI